MSESRQTHVTLHDIDPQALEQLVQYAYTAEIVVGEGNVQVGKKVQKYGYIRLFIGTLFIMSYKAQVNTTEWQFFSTWNCTLPRRCSQQPACCSSMECGTPAVSSSSASWTPPTAWVSEDSLTLTRAATCSSQPTSMSCSTLWRCPRPRSLCCCHWNR